MNCPDGENNPFGLIVIFMDVQRGRWRRERKFFHVKIFSKSRLSILNGRYGLTNQGSDGLPFYYKRSSIRDGAQSLPIISCGEHFLYYKNPAPLIQAPDRLVAQGQAASGDIKQDAINQSSPRPMG